MLLLAVVGCGDGTRDPHEPREVPDCAQWYEDRDGDGFGDPIRPGVVVCTGEDTTGLVENADDCDDSRPAVSPVGVEVCDGRGADEDCDGVANDDDPSRADGTETWPDADLDGHGDPDGAVVLHCEVPAGRADSADDCDDTSAAVFPGAAEHEDPAVCAEDADEDGYGAITPTSPAAAPGTDCDDGLATAWPGADEVFGDLVDQDCDGDAPWFLFDDFEGGSPDPAIWTGYVGEVAVEPGEGLGAYALVMDVVSEVDLRWLDTTACESITFSYWTAGADAHPSGSVALQYSVAFGADWVDLDRWHGTDDGLVFRSGAVTDPGAWSSTLMLRLVAEDETYWSDAFVVDDFRFACPGPDGDGDGFGVRDDCDDADGGHWDDCGACVDADGDGHGAQCDLGADCDDDDAGTFPGNPDVATDGADQDCNGYDGPSLHDTFESATLAPHVWEDVAGAYVDDSDPYEGDWALRFDEGDFVVSQPFDAASCTHLWWSYRVMRGYEHVDLGDSLVVSWDDGAQWVTLDTVDGTGNAEVGFTWRHGVLSDPAALWSGLRLRFEQSASDDRDDFVVDDLLVACSGPDDDLDGFPSDRDCDDTDPAHWEDCGACVDADGDGHGAACDLGPDCDDTDAATSPAAADPYGDGADTSCDGYDGPALVDDFEIGPDPDRWDGFHETTVESESVSGAWSLMFDQEDWAETAAFDASGCPALLWTYQGLRGFFPPRTDEALVLSWHDGAGWVTADQWFGDDESDEDFSLRSGIVDDPLALRPDLRWRLETNRDLIVNRFHVDDLTVACAEPDDDGDGAAFDCNPTDGAHWSDCGVCVDADGDDHGAGCDLGGDCDDADATVFPAAPDPAGDGVATDCSGLDGPSFLDSFELLDPNPAIWDEVTALSDGDESFTGDRSLLLAHTDLATTVPLDFSACASVAWSFRVKFGDPYTPDVGDDLLFEGLTGAGWVELLRVAGGIPLGAFVERADVVTDPALLWSGARIRLRADASSAGDEFYVDDLRVECLP